MNPATSDPEFLEVIEEATNLLTKFVIPIYVEVRGRPIQIGTGFFVRQGDHLCFASAGHVLEMLRDQELFIYISSHEIRKLSGKLFLTPFDANRDDDLLDVGVLRFSGEGKPPYADIEKFAMDISYLKTLPGPRSEKNYAIVGIPASKSRVNPAARQVAAAAYAYRAYSIDDAQYSQHGYDPSSHIILPFNPKRGFDTKGEHRSFPKPNGMSGSPIWILYSDDEANDERVFSVAGIGTRHRRAEGLLIGTDVRVVLDMIQAAI